MSYLEGATIVAFINTDKSGAGKSMLVKGAEMANYRGETVDAVLYLASTGESSRMFGGLWTVFSDKHVYNA
jgi:hypothetical protein